MGFEVVVDNYDDELKDIVTENDLTEIYVTMPEKVLRFTPKSKAFLKDLEFWFKDRLFSAREATEFSEDYYGHHRNWTVRWLNILWQHGKLRKFVKGEWHGGGNSKGGKYWGVHYKICTKTKKN